MWLGAVCPLLLVFAAASASVLQIDQNLKNIKLIESKFIPDVNVLPADQTGISNDDNWQQVRRFMEDGLPVLELYGYKPQRGKYHKSQKMLDVILVTVKLRNKYVDKKKLPLFYKYSAIHIFRKKLLRMAF